jgi:predicted adenylyl cyclase CyaB
MREVELKSVVDDAVACARRVEQLGGRLVFRGRIEDRRFDTPDRFLLAQDHVLRLRVYRDATAGATRGVLDWKGPTRYEAGYKVREELSTELSDVDAFTAILHSLGYVITREIDREIVQYVLHDAVVRFEHYPRMDPLVEVEGAPADIEQAIVAVGLARDGFTTERLPAFVARFEARTGERAAVCDREMAGEYLYRMDDA